MFAGCQAPTREALIESRVLSAEDTLTAYEDWYATTCRACPAGCGLIVRVVEGRARKVEGNPDHPLNFGKSCARGQATVQAQYHPDRLRRPQERSGASVDWDQALQQVQQHLASDAGASVLITPPLRAHRALVVEQFTQALNIEWLVLDITGEASLRTALKQVYNQDRLPIFDIANADYILSFGADFLSTWLSPVHYSRQYGAFRQEGRRGHLVALEPRFSATAAAADEWVPTRPGTEGAVALALAQALRGDAVQAPDGVPAARIEQLATRFRSARRPLAVGGGLVGAQTNGSRALAAILELNALVSTPSIQAAPPPPLNVPTQRPPSTLADWQDLTRRIRTGEVRTLLVLDSNPVYALAGLDFGAALSAGRPFTVAFGSFPDETTALADLVLPTHLPFEDWGSDVAEPSPPQSTLTMQQPLLQPLYDTRSLPDLLIGLGKLPWPSFKDLLQDSARQLQALRRGSIQEPDFERFWSRLLQRGFWADDPAPLAPLTASPNVTLVPSATFDGADFYLVPFVHNTLGEGDAAHLPWLQAAPDPLTSVVWQTWVEVNPRSASQLGVVEGDVVSLESSRGRIEVPVYIHPAAPPDVLGIPLGQGHVSMGRWAKGRGVNPLTILSPLTDADSGALAYGATRVRLTRTGKHVGLPKLEGTVPAYQLPGQEVVKVSAG